MAMLLSQSRSPAKGFALRGDNGVAVLGIIDPAQQLDAAIGPLADLAQEIGARLTRVA